MNIGSVLMFRDLHWYSVSFNKQTLVPFPLFVYVFVSRHAGNDVLCAGGNQWQAMLGQNRNRHLLLQVGALRLQKVRGLQRRRAEKPETVAATGGKIISFAKSKFDLIAYCVLSI